MKIFSKRQINNAYQIGTAYENPDGNIRLSEVIVKPQGSGSVYISIGKFISKKDEFGDTVTEWHHYYYPKEANEKIPGFKSKADYTGKGAASKIQYTFIVPKSCLEDGIGIAIIGSGEGGRGCSRSDIDVILDSERDNIIKQP